MSGGGSPQFGQSDAVTERLVTHVVIGAAALYALTLSVVTWLRAQAFLPESDLAVFTQFVWLMGRADEPFSSITLRPMLADHWEPGLTLLAPIGTLGLGSTGLLVIQAVVIASIAVLLLMLARRLGATGWWAGVVPVLWLISPVVIRANLWDFHPDALIAAALVGCVLALVAGHTLLFGLCVVFALSLKEDAGLTFAALGVSLLLAGYRRAGLVLTLGAGGWALFLNGVILPRLWPSTREHYTARFVGDRGDGFGDAVATWIRHPLTTVTEALTPTTLGILLLLLATSAGCALLAPRWLVAALPLVALNLLSAYEGQHTLRYQYWLVPCAAVAVAGVAGVARLQRSRRPGGAPGTRAVLARGAPAVAGSVLVIASAVALVDVLREIRTEWRNRDDRRAIVAAIPADASVSAPLRYLAQLAERHELYTFPVPFQTDVPESEWEPDEVRRARDELRFVVFDATLTRHPDRERELEERGFVPVLTRGTTTLYEAR